MYMSSYACTLISDTDLSTTLKRLASGRIELLFPQQASAIKLYTILQLPRTSCISLPWHHMYDTMNAANLVLPTPPNMRHQFATGYGENLPCLPIDFDVIVMRKLLLSAAMHPYVGQ